MLCLAVFGFILQGWSIPACPRVPFLHQGYPELSLNAPETLVGSKGTSPDPTVLPVHMGTSVPGTSPPWHLEEP